MKFTDRPWEACERGDYADDGIVIIGDDRRIAVVNQEQDARLIAAAPDLLEALQEVFDAVMGVSVPSAAWDKARAAIAKALGHEPPR